jgi:hypothetical protein
MMLLRAVCSASLLVTTLAQLETSGPEAINPVSDDPNKRVSRAEEVLGSRQAPPARCAPVHIIAARASGEAPGYGIIQALADQLKRQIPGATSAPVDYPAVLQYARSTPVGVTNMKRMIADYTAACPTAKLVLIGYSQGGAVTVDTLCGGGGKDVGPPTPGLTAEEGRLIKAAVSFGDPRFVPGVSYALGTNKGPKGGVS